MSLSRRLAALAALLVLGVAAMARAELLPPVVITGDPVAASPSTPGSGVCIAERISTNPSADFPLTSASAFVNGVNNLLETPPDSSNLNPRVSTVLRTLFDLSNNNTSGEKLSYGDFINAVPGCPTGGCDFFVTDSSVAYGLRLRGYLNVTPAMVGLSVHFGFYADDGVVFNLYDRQSIAYRIVSRPRQDGAATWRTTNSVTFLKPGLYPVEVLYAEVTEHAALEMSVLVGNFTDFDRPANQSPVVKLSNAGFSLLAPASFYQTESGRTSYADPTRCQQCNRQYANTAGNNGCDPAYYCNGAALCAPCDSAIFCGPSCSPCGPSTPQCINRNGTFTCVQCSDDSQCPTGYCDASTNQCRGCRTDSNCPSGLYCAPDLRECRECTKDDHCGRGQVCVNNACQSCSTQSSCAGTSCNCCPEGLKCGSPTPGASPSCVQCTGDSDCAEGKVCDPLNGRCVDKVAECNTAERCGDQCVKCPSERPYCLDGQVCVECRSDLECGDGKFCLSGQCSLCTTDKRCGARCGACPAPTPFCLTDGTIRGSSCIGCRGNADCGPGGTCDSSTHTCSATTCSASCASGTVCYGDACVQCFADAHCPCGGTCDTATNTCSTSCKDSGDCTGAQFCSPATQQCEDGRRKPGADPQGGAPCCGATGNTPPGGLVLLLLLAVLRARRPRGAA